MHTVVYALKMHKLEKFLRTVMKPHFLKPLQLNQYSSDYVNDIYLPLPKADKIWLRSPPGSPPLDWKSAPEESPNKLIHHPVEDYDSLPMIDGHPAILVEDYSDHIMPIKIIEMPLQHKSLIFTKHNIIPQTRMPPQYREK